MRRRSLSVGLGASSSALHPSLFTILALCSVLCTATQKLTYKSQLLVLQLNTGLIIDSSCQLCTRTYSADVTCMIDLAHAVHCPHFNVHKDAEGRLSNTQMNLHSLRDAAQISLRGHCQCHRGEEEMAAGMKERRPVSSKLNIYQPSIFMGPCRSFRRPLLQQQQKHNPYAKVKLHRLTPARRDTQLPNTATQ